MYCLHVAGIIERLAGFVRESLAVNVLSRNDGRLQSMAAVC